MTNANVCKTEIEMSITNSGCLAWSGWQSSLSVSFSVSRVDREP